MRRLEFTRTLAATGLVAAARPVEAQTALVPLRLGTNAADDVTPLLWAKASGMFAKAGLDVDIQKFTSGSAVTAAVIGGSLDIGRSSLLPLISARAHGVPMQLIAPAEVAIGEDLSGGIITLKDSGIYTGKDLAGKTVPSPSLKDYFEISTRAWIDMTGGDSKTVKFIELPISTVLAALEQGRVAAAAIPNPFLATAIASGKVRLIGRPNMAIAKRFLITAWCATETFITANRPALQKFTQTLHDSVLYTNTHQAETVAVTSSFWGVDPTIVAGMARTAAASSLDPKDIQPMIDVALRYGVIEKPMRAETMISPIAVRARS